MARPSTRFADHLTGYVVVVQIGGRDRVVADHCAGHRGYVVWATRPPAEAAARDFAAADPRGGYAVLAVTCALTPAPVPARRPFRSTHTAKRSTSS